MVQKSQGQPPVNNGIFTYIYYISWRRVSSINSMNMVNSIHWTPFICFTRKSLLLLWDIMFLSIVSAFQHIPGLGICRQNTDRSSPSLLGLRSVSRCNSAKSSLQSNLWKTFLKKSSQILPSWQTHQISRILLFSSMTVQQTSPRNWIMWLGSLEALLILSKVPRWKKFNKNSPRHSELGFSFVEFRRGNVEGADGADIFHDAGAHFRGVTWEVEVLCVRKVEDLKIHSVLLRIICSLIIIITKTVKIDSIENLYWMCFHCVLCLGSIGNISEHVLTHGTLPIWQWSNQMDVWRKTCRFDDREEETETNFHTMLNSLQLKWMKRDVFFLPDQTYSQKGPNKKPRESKKQQNKSLFWSAFGRMAFGACGSKIRPCGRLVADVARRYLFFWVSALVRRYLCWGISLGKSAETSKRPFMRTGKKIHQQIWTIYGSYEAQKL